MKPPVAKLLPLLQKESAGAIEKRAAVELNPEVIRMSIFKAAREGQKAYRVRIPDTLNVRGTESATILETWCKENDLTITWESREVTLEDGRRASVIEPEISWLVL